MKIWKIIPVLLALMMLVLPGCGSSLEKTGGTRLVYEADLGDVPGEEQDQKMDDVVSTVGQIIKASGITDYTVERQGSERILIELPGVSDADQVQAVLEQKNILEFGELAADPNDPDIKWRNELGDWKPATGTLNGQQAALNSDLFNDSGVTTNDFGEILLEFEWNEEGSELSKEITTRLYNDNHAPMGIFSGSEALKGEDGKPIAPYIYGIITDRGIIEGLNQTEVVNLASMLLLGRNQVALTLIDKQIFSP